MQSRLRLIMELAGCHFTQKEIHYRHFQWQWCQQRLSIKVTFIWIIFKLVVSTSLILVPNVCVMIPSSGANIFEEVSSLSPALDTFGCPVPTTNDFGKGAVLDTTKALFCGGIQSESNVCKIYELGSTGFTSHPQNLLQSRKDNSVARVGGKLWVAGGVTSGAGM